MFRVRIEGEARNNLRKHYQDLRSCDPGSRYPDQWYYGIRAAIRDLAESGQQCRVAYEDRFFAETMRLRPVDSYKILFAIRKDTVHVLHIRHQAQDPEDLLP